VDNPTYEQVSSGDTNHAEAIQIEFDPKVISFEKLLEVFWALHDPTTLNQQGADVGTQYRSAIFYHDNAQKEIAEKSLKKAEQSGVYSDKFVTEIVPFPKFYKAEDYHVDYYEQNKNSNPYCRIVIDPKIRKLYKEFGDNLKD
jgi:peptide-methionine (S)-S-oxide reductase